MCAQVLKFRAPSANSGADVEAADQAAGIIALDREPCDDTTALQFWVGASGSRYIHTVHSLLQCPELPAVNYLLVHRDANGLPKVLAAGHTKNDAPSLNLAEIRRHGATLGANEVHVHMLTDNTSAAKVVEHDLRQAQLQGTLPPGSQLAH
ncbi:MAG: hypothetical protein KJ622_10250 [Alphaproteobacteria bacterium]|nr:hypothetical protein [Alphaproteobacteria bacterium]